MGILSQIKQTCDRFKGTDRLLGTKEFNARKQQWWKYEDPMRVVKRAERLGMPKLASEVVKQAMRPAETSMAEKLALDPLERIKGRNDLMSSLFLSVGWERARAVGRIMTAAGFGFGTGFLISNRLLMTNRHVLETASFASRCHVQFDYVIGFDGRTLTPVRFRLRPGEFFIASAPAANGDDLDYAVVAVEQTSANGVELQSRGHIPLIAETGKASLNEPVNIIQHPGGGPQQVAVRDNLIVELLPSYLRYETDTQPGSSGSPAFNGQWEIAALHHSGVPTEEPPGSGIYLLNDGTTWDPSIPLSRPEQIARAARIVWKSNEGVRISVIVSDIRRRLAGSPAKLAIFEEAVVEQVAPALPTAPPPPERRLMQSGTDPSGFADDWSGKPVVTADGSVTWTLPLQLSVRLGNVAGGGPPNISDVNTTLTDTQHDDLHDTDSAETPLELSSKIDEAVRQVRDALAGESNVVEVRSGYLFDESTQWISNRRAVVIVVRPGTDVTDLLERLNVSKSSSTPVDVTPASPEEMLAVERDQFPAEMRESLDLSHLFREATGNISYDEPEGVELEEINEPMEVICHVSPDQGWPVLKEFLDGTSSRLTVGMYDFTAPHVFNKLFDEVKPANREFTLVIQEKAAGVGSGTKKRDIPEDKVIKSFADELEHRFKQEYAIVTGPHQIFETSYHIKVAVRNHTQFWLSSGNWQSSNQPEIDPAGDGSADRKFLETFNREWHVWVKNAKLARLFERYLLHDLQQIQDTKQEFGIEAVPIREQLPDLLIPAALLDGRERLLPPDDSVVKYFKRKRFRKDPDKPVRVQPLLTPDRDENEEPVFQKHVLELVRSAKKTLYFQNQTLSPTKDRANNQPKFLELIDAIKEKQADPDVDVRIILRVFFFSQIRPILERLKDLGVDTDDIRLQDNCHTKGIIVDSKTVLVGSHNWSNSGTLFNRDASLIFRHKEIAQYFEEIFLFDWEHLASQQMPSAALAPEIAMPGAPVPLERIRVPWRHVFED